MAAKALTTKPTLAQLEAQRRELDAQITQARADGGAAAPAAAAEEEEAAEVAAEEPAEAAAPAEEPAPEEEEDGEEKPTPTADAAAEREQILASAEAESHPQLAMAAVRDGMTFVQFKGQVAAASKEPRRGALHAVLADSRRLGPDAAKQADGRSGESRLMASAARMAEAAKSPRR